MRRTKATTQTLWNEHVFKRQTVADLMERYKKSRNWVQRRIDEAHVTLRSSEQPQHVVAVFDATHIGDEDILLMARAPHERINLGWVWIPSETKGAYAGLRTFIEQKGYTLAGVVLDGRTGIPKVFEDIPVQICQFHQLQIVRRKLTLNPETKAGQILLSLMFTIASSDHAVFEKALAEWFKEYEPFITERTYVLGTRRWHYTHRRVRSAYLSLKRNLPYLFTYQKYPELNMPNTTNSLDGFWSRVKNLLSAHRGKSKERKRKIVTEILRNTDCSKGY